jgi:hypothetical protein
MNVVWSAKIASPNAFPKPVANEGTKKTKPPQADDRKRGGIRGRGGEGGKRGKCCGKREEAEKETD